MPERYGKKFRKVSRKKLGSYLLPRFPLSKIDFAQKQGLFCGIMRPIMQLNTFHVATHELLHRISSPTVLKYHSQLLYQAAAHSTLQLLKRNDALNKALIPAMVINLFMISFFLTLRHLKSIKSVSKLLDALTAISVNEAVISCYFFTCMFALLLYISLLAVLLDHSLFIGNESKLYKAKIGLRRVVDENSFISDASNAPEILVGKLLRASMHTDDIDAYICLSILLLQDTKGNCSYYTNNLKRKNLFQKPELSQNTKKSELLSYYGALSSLTLTIALLTISCIPIAVSALIPSHFITLERAYPISSLTIILAMFSFCISLLFFSKRSAHVANKIIKNTAFQPLSGEIKITANSDHNDQEEGLEPPSCTINLDEETSTQAMSKVLRFFEALANTTEYDPFTI